MHATTRRRRARGLATASLTTLALTVVALGGAPAASSAPTPGTTGGIVGGTAVDGAAQRAALDFWTPARIAAARPADPEGGLVGALPRTGVSSSTTTGSTTTGSGTTGDGAAPAAPRAGTLATGGTPTLPRRARGAAGVVTGSAVSQASPWTAASPATARVGRVYFSRLDPATGRSEPFVCSASSVASANQSVLVTAGHCLTQGGQASTNVVFIPGAAGSSRPYGTWSAKATFTTSQWATGDQKASAALNYDVGFVVLGARSGKTLGATVGSFGIGFDAPLDRVTVLGYPASSGNTLQYCTGYRFPDPAGTSDQGTMCAIGGGSSGGPWLSGLDPVTGSGTVTGVVSFSYDDAPDVLYAPRLGSVVKAQYDKAQAVPVT